MRRDKFVPLDVPRKPDPKTKQVVVHLVGTVRVVAEGTCTIQVPADATEAEVRALAAALRNTAQWELNYEFEDEGVQGVEVYRVENDPECEYRMDARFRRYGKVLAEEPK